MPSPAFSSVSRDSQSLCRFIQSARVGEMGQPKPEGIVIYGLA